MIVINFTNTQQYLKGTILQQGVNVVNNENITEADRSDIIGIGADDMAHYKEVLEFFAVTDIFVEEGTYTRAIKEIYNRLCANRELIKQEGFLISEEQKTETTRYSNINALNQSIKNDTEAIKKFFSIIESERKPLSEAIIKAIKKEFADIENYKNKFKIVEVAKEIYKELLSEKKQHLGYELTQIKKVLGV